MLSLKKISDFIFAHSFSLHQLLHSVYSTASRLHNVLIIGVFLKYNQCSRLGNTIDALIIGDIF